MRCARLITLSLVAAMMSLAVAPPIVYGQDLTETFTWEDGSLTLTYPQEWYSRAHREYVVFGDSYSPLYINMDERHVAVVVFDPIEVPGPMELKLLAAILGEGLVNELVLDAGAVLRGQAVETRMAGHSLAYVDLEGDDLEASVLVRQLGVDHVLIAVALITQGRIEELRPTALAMVASARYGEGDSPDAGGALRSPLIRTLERHTSFVDAIAFNPGGDRLVSVDHDGVVVEWDVATGEKLAEHERPVVGLVRALAYQDDGTVIIAEDDPATHDLRLWRSTDGDAVTTLPGAEDAIISAAFSPDMAQVATASKDQTVRIFDVAGGQSTYVFEGHASSVVHVIFSADGQRIASAGRDFPVLVWEPDTDDVIATLDADSGNILDIAFSVDGAYLAAATGEPDNTILVWDVANGKPLSRLDGHSNIVVDVAFSPLDAHLLASCSDDGTVRLWDTVSGTELAMLTGHTSAVARIEFSPDGAMIASASWDGTVKLWDVSHLSPPETTEDNIVT